MKKRLVLLFISGALMLGTVACGPSAQLQQDEEVTEKEQTTVCESTAVDEPQITYEVMTEEDLEEEAYYDSLELLALMVEAEAGNQDIEGKKLVVDVVLNRVDSEDFPDNILDVITQMNAFTSYWDGGIDRVWEASESTYEAVREELVVRTNSEVLYFTSEGYSEYGTPWRKVGDHYFSTK